MKKKKDTQPTSAEFEQLHTKGYEVFRKLSKDEKLRRLVRLGINRAWHMRLRYRVY